MDIYIEVWENGFGESHWVYQDELEQDYLDDFYDDYDNIIATAFHSVEEAKEAAELARRMMIYNGVPGEVFTDFYILKDNGKLSKIEFTEDNKIKEKK